MSNFALGCLPNEKKKEDLSIVQAMDVMTIGTGMMDRAEAETSVIPTTETAGTRAITEIGIAIRTETTEIHEIGAAAIHLVEIEIKTAEEEAEVAVTNGQDRHLPSLTATEMDGNDHGKPTLAAPQTGQAQRPRAMSEMDRGQVYVHLVANGMLHRLGHPPAEQQEAGSQAQVLCKEDSLHVVTIVPLLKAAVAPSGTWQHLA